MYCTLRLRATPTWMPTSLPAKRSRGRGFSLLELAIVLVVAALLMSIAVPTYGNYMTRAKVATVVTDMGQMELALSRYQVANNGVQATSLAEIGMDTKLDPWGNPYQYLDMTNIHGHGGVRKDRNLVPINTDYDLYSMGPDGRSVAPLTASASRDDIIRANNGAYLGLASDY
jgi:general secretion pathway protein G